MSEKQQRLESCTVINDISQGSVPTAFACGGTFDFYFVTDLLLSLL